jgi:16S rRNA (guanine527-N7)-methyltransferase
VLTGSRLRQLLQPFEVDLSPTQAGQTLAYLQLLQRWNEKINLTAIRDVEEAITRHFGECLFVAKHVHLHGSLLDIGSGAGFPGLALKIVSPDLSVTLLEPVTKKRAFLKEAARVCGFTQVTVHGQRLEELASDVPTPAYDFATVRAVGNLAELIPLASNCLTPGGSLLLWLTQEQAANLTKIASGLTWANPLPIPLSRTAGIWHGIKPG